jgi:hypothetical protein
MNLIQPQQGKSGIFSCSGFQNRLDGTRAYLGREGDLV